MKSRIIVQLFSLLITGISCNIQHYPRATSTYLNATSTGHPESAIFTCCAINANIVKIVWWSSSVEVTVATVSTIVYQYDNTAVTSYRTIRVNNSQSLPTDYFSEKTSISGVPTTLIDISGPYEKWTTIVYGTEYTDPYGMVHTSPTPVLEFPYATVLTGTKTMTGSNSACSDVRVSDMDVDVRFDVYPSGFYLDDVEDSSYGRNNTGELFMLPLPTQLRDWMASHVPPENDTSIRSATHSIYSFIADCTMVGGDGAPTAHIPVNELTVAVVTTTTIAGNLGGKTKTTELHAQSTGLATISGTTVKPPPDVTYTSSVLYIEPIPAPVSTPPEVNTRPTPTPESTKSEEYGQPALTSSIYAVMEVANPSYQTVATEDSALGFNTGSHKAHIFSTSGPALVDNSATQKYSVQAYTALSPLPSPTATILVIESSTYRLNSDSAFAIGSQTLTPGGALTVPGGATVSLETGGASVVLADGGSTSTQGLGGVINSMGGFGEPGSTSSRTSGNTTESGPLQITSSGARVGNFWEFERLVGLWMGVMGGVMML